MMIRRQLVIPVCLLLVFIHPFAFLINLCEHDGRARFSFFRGLFQVVYPL